MASLGPGLLPRAVGDPDNDVVTRHGQLQRRVEAAQLRPSDTPVLASAAISITTPTMTAREGLSSGQRPADASARRPHARQPAISPGPRPSRGFLGPDDPAKSP